MIYAIIEAGGRQFWIQPGHFYDFNKVNVKPGEIIKFKKVLFIHYRGKIIIGQPCIKHSEVVGKVLTHIKGRKIKVFKMKAKKNYSSNNSHRQLLTRILIENIQIKSKANGT